MTTHSHSITPLHAAMALRAGKVIAYPTEAVYGLGCDPFNERAVKRLLQLKQRDLNKGLILLASSWQQIEFLVDKSKIAEERLKEVLATWPGAITWVLPAASTVPTWVRGAHTTIALRVTAHPIARAICEAFGCPMVSTSANRAELAPARTYQEVLDQFERDTVLIVQGEVGTLSQPTPIHDALTGKTYRL